MKTTKRTWKVAMIVVNDITENPGSLTKLLTHARVKQIIQSEIDKWRDLKVKDIRVVVR
jgi:ABC-type phosphate transport system substrate-binding protein